MVTQVSKVLFYLPIKIHGDSYSFDIAESEYDNQIVLSSTNVKEKRLNAKTKFGVRKTPHWFLITVYSTNIEQRLYIRYPK
jgi:hypothetical protein